MIKIFEDIFALIGSLCLFANLALLAIFGVEEIERLKQEGADTDQAVERFREKFEKEGK